MNEAQKNILDQVAGIREIPTGAYNIRVDGSSVGRSDSEHVSIIPKADNAGIEIHIKPNTKGETIYIPVVVSHTGLVDAVQNDFFIGEGADVTIIAGCGIHNDGNALSQHDGIHTFHVGQKARVVYTEKHYGCGEGSGARVLNPVTDIYLAQESYMEMDTVQIKGVDSTRRLTKAVIGDNATLVISEKLMTHGTQHADTEFIVELNGENSSTNVISRAVAKDSSSQTFFSKINGNNRCMGHSECDAIIMDKAIVKAVPEITASHVDASLIHEAAIGKIAGEQIIKLMTLGLNQEEAEAQIINGFLK